MRALSKTARRAGLVMIFGLVYSFHAENPLARPLVPAERRYLPFSPDLPSCGDPGVLERIQSRFHDRETEYWSTGLEIAVIDQVTERGYRTAGEDYIPRRYCRAEARMNDSTVYPVTYTINQDLGIIGFGYGVTWCVTGLDRHDAYSPACTMLAP